MSDPHGMKDFNPQIQEAHSAPRRINTKKTTCRPDKVNMMKTKGKEKIFKANRGKRIYLIYLNILP